MKRGSRAAAPQRPRAASGCVSSKGATPEIVDALRASIGIGSLEVDRIRPDKCSANHDDGVLLVATSGAGESDAERRATAGELVIAAVSFSWRLIDAVSILSRMERYGIQLKRAYEAASPHDGYRVLVERLWPRGVRKADLRLDAWLKDIAPSAELRRWFGHDPCRFNEFAARYRHELRRSPAAEALATLQRRVSQEPVTLVYAAHDETHNGAVVLRSEMERNLAGHAHESHP
jgi:uncharacterized protein YeaO (DUF488 family)